MLLANVDTVLVVGAVSIGSILLYGLIISYAISGI